MIYESLCTHTARRAYVHMILMITIIMYMRFGHTERAHMRFRHAEHTARSWVCTERERE